MTLETATLIANATDHPDCSNEEYHIAQFIKSCVNYVTRANMREVIFCMDINIIKEIIDMAEEDRLENAVRELNPKLLEIT
jgi:exonuclease III